MALAASSVLVFAGCGGGSSSQSGNNSANSSSSLVQPEVYAQEKMDVSSLNQAVQQYNAAEGHFPAQLQDLTPTYIAKIPQAPPGYKINYDATSGSVSVVHQ